MNGYSDNDSMKLKLYRNILRISLCQIGQNMLHMYAIHYTFLQLSIIKYHVLSSHNGEQRLYFLKSSQEYLTHTYLKSINIFT